MIFGSAPLQSQHLRSVEGYNDVKMERHISHGSTVVQTLHALEGVRVCLQCGRHVEDSQGNFCVYIYIHIYTHAHTVVFLLSGGIARNTHPALGGIQLVSMLYELL